MISRDIIRRRDVSTQTDWAASRIPPTHELSQEAPVRMEEVVAMLLQGVRKTIIFTAAAFTLLLTSSSAMATECPPEIQEGVTTVVAPGVTGTLSVFGPKAFSVASAPLGKDKGIASIIAAGEYGKGRVVCAAHPGYLDVRNLNPGTTGETGRLVSNLVVWLGESRLKAKKPLRIVCVDNPNLATSLASAGFQTKSIAPKDLKDALSQADLLMFRPSKINRADVPKVIDFVTKGGSVYLADAGWIWAGYDAKKGERLAEDFAGNRIAHPAGIVFTSGTAATQKEPIPARNEGDNYLHALIALDYVSKNATTDQKSPEMKQARESVTRAISALSADDDIFLPRIEEACQVLKTKPIPGPKNAIHERYPLSRFYVAAETKRTLAATPDKPFSSEFAAVFPGMAPRTAKPVKQQKLSIDTSRRRWHSTGLYAQPGDVIEVTVPPAVAKAQKPLSVRIGCHTDRLWHKEDWKRAPEISRVFPIASTTTKATNGFGGLIYIDVPADCPLGEIEVSISGGTPAPLFHLGKTTNAEWKKIRTRPAPWAEIGSDKLVITVPSEAIRNYDNPHELMVFWDQVMDACADLATIPTERSSAERIVVDAQISAGYLHAGYPIMGPLSTTKNLLDLETLKAKGNWGYYHEIGHNHQRREWTWTGLTEVTVNLFTMYALDTLNPSAPHHNAVIPENMAKRTADFAAGKNRGDPFTQLVPYIELKNSFGWQPFQKVFAEYRELSDKERPKTLQECKDQWLIRMSKATGRNLGPFYDFWALGASDAAKKEVSHLPVWNPHAQK